MTEKEEPVEEEEIDWQDRALRAQAEIQNLRKQQASAVEEMTQSRMESLFLEVITLRDHLGLALQAGESDEQAAGLAQGVAAIHASMDILLGRYGVEAIEPTPETTFDPGLHEAMGMEDREDLDAPQLVLVRAGYRLGRRILRPAQVKILQPAKC